MPAGSVLLVVGPSGSGKSTLGLAIAGLVPTDVPATMAGALEIDGRDVRSMPRTAIGATVGLVFQDPSSQIVMDRVEDDVAFGLEARAWARERMATRIPAALAAVGLAGFERRRTRRLSGGQQQRLALAGVLAPEPAVLVLDEPTANLDPEGAAAFQGRLAAIRDARSTTVVLVEHRVEAAWALADLVLALDGDGRPIDVGTPDAVGERSAMAMRAAGIWLPDRWEPSPERHRVGGLPPASRDSMDPLVTTSGLTFGYERSTPVVRDVDLEIARGGSVALVGPNGSGKSTLARLLVGLLRPDAGRVALLGDDPSRLAPAELASRAGFVFQEPERQFLAQRVLDEVMLGLPVADRPRAEALMDRLGLPLETFAERSPYRLSGGEGRRLSLACALVRDPCLLVLDEPTFGQDRHGYEGLRAILEDRLAAGTTLVLATHDERLVADIASRVVRLDAGRIARDEAVPA